MLGERRLFLAAGLVLLTTACLTNGSSPSRPVPDTMGYGMQVEPGNNLERALTVLAAAGFQWAKVQVRWENIEREPGNVNWLLTDTVTDEVKEILGVTCAVVHNLVKENGEVIEDTEDWYAQDIFGNVWYFGEIAQDFEDGELVSIDGSWKAGVDGAKAGIIMKAAPAVGDVYRQEFSLGNAEDLAEVLSLTGSEVVPAATCNGDCLVTRDFTPLQPDVSEHKYYKPGFGLILEVNPDTGDRVELVG